MATLSELTNIDSRIILMKLYLLEMESPLFLKAKQIISDITFNLNRNRIYYDREIYFPLLCNNKGKGLTAYFKFYIDGIERIVRISDHDKPYSFNYYLNFVITKNSKSEDIIQSLINKIIS